MNYLLYYNESNNQILFLSYTQAILMTVDAKLFTKIN